MTTTPAGHVPPHTPARGEEQPQTAGAAPQIPRVLTRAHKFFIGFVAAGAVAIAGIGFAGSYTAVTELARAKGFGNFSNFFTLGIDIGIAVFLALDLLLTWLRIPFPLLRQGAWLLTAATICFNAAAAWPDALGVGMHAVIPILFVISVEAARHAVGRIADITADKHIESPPMSRWFLDPVGTFRIWRRQRLWQLKSYEDVIAIERDAAKYRQKLRSTHGWRWRRKAQQHEVLALFNVRFGTPVADSLAEHDAELAAAKTASNDRQQPSGAPTTAATNSASSTASERHIGRQNQRQEPTTGDTASTANSDKNAGRTASGGDKTDRQKARRKAANGASNRRPMTEWVELAGPVFHRQFRELRQMPTGRQFADAIADAGLGDVSESTAKNIRQAVLDNEPLPALT